MSVNAVEYTSKKSNFGATAAAAFKEHKNYLYFCVLFYLLTFLVLNLATGYADIQYVFDVVGYFVRSILIFGTIAVTVYITIVLIKERPKSSPIKFAYQAVRENILTRENTWRIIFGTTGLAFVLSAFLVLKASIPEIIPFSYDAKFEIWDRILHFGHQPWALLQPVLGYEYVTVVMHKLYYLWFPVLFTTFFWQVGTRQNSKLRLQFITSFVMCWALIGGVMATLLSSAGPIYFDRILADATNPYFDAANYLSAINEKHGLYMFEIKEVLWESYINRDSANIVKGISAMPSMHVSIAFLMALFGWKKGPYFGIAYTMFFIAILLGSVHLLWHYAIDGYVSIIATWIIWSMCGRFIKNAPSQV